MKLKKLPENQQELIYWIKERNSIRKKKEAGEEKPWTMNWVMRETYFCNVNREDDRVTKWIRENWKYKNSPEFYDFAMIVARIFNLPATLEAVQQPLDIHFWIENAEEELSARRDAGNKIWNGAYIVSTNGRSIDKLTHCMDIFKGIQKNPQITKGCETLKEAHTELIKVYGLASFMAAQVVADLKNSKGHPLQDAPDWMTFSAFGPGSLRGLSWFWEKEITKRTYDKAIEDAYEIVRPHLPKKILKTLCMQNFQNCFCEYDKFMRVTNKTGRSKRKYNGERT